MRLKMLRLIKTDDLVSISMYAYMFTFHNISRKNYGVRKYAETLKSKHKGHTVARCSEASEDKSRLQNNNAKWTKQRF